MADESPIRRALREELLRIRRAAGLSGRGIAPLLDMNRGAVWRFDDGQQPMPLDKVRAWLDVCGVVGDTRDHVLELADRVDQEARPWRDLLADRDHLQDTAAARESTATAVRGFQPTLWPGVLQTPEYAHLVFSHGRTKDVDAAVTRRIARQSVLRGDTTLDFLIGERVLRADLGRADILAGQIDRARSLVSHLATVTVRVVPDTVAALPWQNFYLWSPAEGSTYVTIELVHGEQRITSPADVDVYEQLWGTLSAEASDLDDDVLGRKRGADQEPGGDTSATGSR